MSIRQKFFVLLIVLVCAITWNWEFIKFCDKATILKMNDVKAILNGFEKTPNLLKDGLKWWHGPWIQEGINAFRPITSYLYWIECWIGLRYGFLWVGFVGFLLFLMACLLSTTLSWRLTKSVAFTTIGAILASRISLHNFQPPGWLAWFPCHQEVLLSILILGALICFDIWIETQKNQWILLSYFLFIIGCLVKEHFYIFPAMAALLSFCRKKNSKVATQIWLIHVAIMMAFVVALWFYRAAVIENPYNPTIKPIQLVSKPMAFMFTSFWRYLFSGQWWFAGWAFLLFALVGGWVKYVHKNPSSVFTRLYVIVPAIILASFLYLSAFAPISPAEAVLWILIPPIKNAHLQGMVEMIFTLYALYLLWLYQKCEPTFLALSLIFLIHLPIIDYIGWHYTISAWFLWSPYWALVAKLIWRNCGKPYPSNCFFKKFFNQNQNNFKD